MVNHITIILFDSSDKDTFSSTIVSNFYNALLDTPLHDNSMILYLNIPHKSTTQKYQKYPIKKISATSFGKNNCTVLERKYNFKDYLSLKGCLSFIKRKFSTKGDQIKWYFICIGHGFGYTFFDFDNDPKRSKASFDNILYGPELARAFGKIKLRLAYFNTCNFSLIQNCNLFASKAKFLIGTENYTTVLSFNPAKYIELLNDRIQNNIDSYKFSKNFFIDLHTRFEKFKLDDSDGQKGFKNSSIFLYKLENHMHNINNDFNILCSIVLTNHIHNINEWYEKFRTTLTQKTSNDLSYIDITEICKQFASLFPIDKELQTFTNRIPSQIAKLKCLNDSDAFVENNSNSGLTVYLQEFGRKPNIHYTRFKTKCAFMINDFIWDKKFVEIIDDKFS